MKAGQMEDWAKQKELEGNGTGDHLNSNSVSFFHIFISIFGAIVIGSISFNNLSKALQEETLHLRIFHVTFSLFSAVLTFCLIASIFRMLKNRRIASKAADIMAKHPDKPWLCDWRWAEAHIFEHSCLRKSFIQGVFSILTSVIVLTIFIFLCKSAQAFPIVMVVLGIVGFILFGYCFSTAVGFTIEILCAFKLKAAKLEFDFFPFRKGGEMLAKLHLPELGKVDKMEVQLLCWQEEKVKAIDDTDSNHDIVHSLKYADRLLIDEKFELNNGSAPLPVKFNIPQDTPSTQLLPGTEKPIYWELHVITEAKTKGKDYRSVFLLPVY